MKIVVQTLSYKSSWARMFLWLTSGVSPAARTWLIATAISVGLKGSKGCADWDLYCTGDPAESSQVNNNSIHLSKNSTNAPTFPSLIKTNSLTFIEKKDRRLQCCHQTWIMVLLHFEFNSDTSIARIRGSPEDYCLFSKMNTLTTHGSVNLHLFYQKQAPKFPHSWMKICSSPYIFTVIGWIIGGRDKC